MARRVEGVEFKRTYDWDRFFDGSQWEFVQGTDFNGRPSSFQSVVNSAAQRLGKQVITKTEGNKVYLQAMVGEGRKYLVPKARKVSGIVFKHEVYNEEWLDGNQWELRHGEDYTGNPRSFAGSLSGWARRRGLKAATKITGMTIYFQVVSDNGPNATA